MKTKTGTQISSILFKPAKPRQTNPSNGRWLLLAKLNTTQRIFKIVWVLKTTTNCVIVFKKIIISRVNPWREYYIVP